MKMNWEAEGSDWDVI